MNTLNRKKISANSSHDKFVDNFFPIFFWALFSFVLSFAVNAAGHEPPIKKALSAILSPIANAAHPPKKQVDLRKIQKKIGSLPQ